MPAESSAGTLASLFESPTPELRVRLEVGRPPWWAAFGRLRLLVALVAAPVLWHEYAGQVGGWEALSWGWRLALLAVVVPASLTVSTYVPQRSAGGVAGGSPCAAMAGLTVIFAGIALGGAPLQVATLVLAAGLAGYGLRQRLRGAEACAPRPW